MYSIGLLIYSPYITLKPEHPCYDICFVFTHRYFPECMPKLVFVRFFGLISINNVSPQTALCLALPNPEHACAIAMMASTPPTLVSSQTQTAGNIYKKVASDQNRGESETANVGPQQREDGME